MKPEPAPPSRIEAFKATSEPGTTGRDFLISAPHARAHKKWVDERWRAEMTRRHPFLDKPKAKR